MREWCPVCKRYMNPDEHGDCPCCRTALIEDFANEEDEQC